MPEFQLRAAGLDSLDEFTLGYIEALFFTDQGEDNSEEWTRIAKMESEPISGSFPNDLGVLDLSPESLDRIKRDCAAFQEAAATFLAQAYNRGYDANRAGNDFHYTRNGHGVGFWDRCELEADSLGERLSEIAYKAGAVESYWGDDSKIYLS